MRLASALTALAGAAGAANAAWGMPFAGGGYGYASLGPGGGNQTYFVPPAQGYARPGPYGGVGQPPGLYPPQPPPPAYAMQPPPNYAMQPQQPTYANQPPPASPPPPPAAQISQDAKKTQIVTPRASIEISPPVIQQRGPKFNAERFRSALIALLGTLDGGEPAPKARFGAPPAAGPQQPKGNPPQPSAFDGETICFPSQSPIVQRFLSRVTPSVVQDEDHTTSVLCYKAAELRSAGVLA